MRRNAGRCLHTAICAAAALAILSFAGCDRPSDPAADRRPTPTPMTEDEYVEHVAALTLAVEDGLSGEDARARVAELGAPVYTREEVEAFAEALRTHPEWWAAVAERVDRKITDLRGPGGSAEPSEALATEGDPGAGAPAGRVETDRPLDAAGSGR